MTNNFENEKNNAIVKAQSQQLAVRNAWLVERGVHSLTIQGITECRIMEFCSILNAVGDKFSIPDIERTLKTIADIGSDIRSNRHHLDLLIFVLLDYYYTGFFARWRVPSFWNGSKSDPIVRKHLMLVCAALRALVDSIASPHEAIWDVLYYGTTHFPVPVASTCDLGGIGSESVFCNGKFIPYEEYIRYMTGTPGFPITDTRILAIDWLLDWFKRCDHAYRNLRKRLQYRADGKHRVIKTTRDLFSDYLSTMLLSTVQITPFLFKLKYADALINNHIDEAVYFFIDMIKLKKEVGSYVHGLCRDATKYYNTAYSCNKISRKTLVYALNKLTELGDEYAESLFSMIANLPNVYAKDFRCYSDVELEVLSRVCTSVSAQVERDSPDYYACGFQDSKELIMAELKRRGLHG